LYKATLSSLDNPFNNSGNFIGFAFVIAKDNTFYIILQQNH
jgi:hypothetical protein